jgi:DNA repair protein RadA/Sms
MRLQTGPWDECFGTDYISRRSGIVNTSVTLLGGAPGAGKSTFSLQLADAISASTLREVLYIAAEEDAAEVLARARRIQIKNLNRIRIYPMGATTELSLVFASRKPAAIVVDSLPKLVPDHDQAVEFCERFKPYTIEMKAPAIIIDQVNKEGDFAGLMKLQHAVDTLLIFYKVDEHTELRELHVEKNRFGIANISKFLMMTETGLVEHIPEDDATLAE